MPKLSPSQLRAARALLNWSRAELAKRSGISEPTLHRFENGENEPNKKTTSKLFAIFDKHGVEFTDKQGVQFKSRSIEIFDGLERFDDFYDFLYEHLKQNGGDVCLHIYYDDLLLKLRKDPNLHRRRMKELHDKGIITFRIITTMSDFNTSYGYAKYKCQPNAIPNPTGFYAFGDCLALMTFVNEKTPHVVVMHNGPLAEGYRQAFEIAWKHASPPPTNKTTKRKL